MVLGPRKGRMKPSPAYKTVASASGIAQYNNPSNDEALKRVHANLVKDINYYEKKKPKGCKINISDKD